MKAPVPQNERERLDALHEYGVLDTLPERDFDDLALLAAQMCGTPIALVSLVDRDRQWFKSNVGLAITQTPRVLAFCAHAICEPDLMIVRDAASDARFSDHPLVMAEPYIRFYAGAPLITSEGHALGTLCVIDSVSRELTPAQTEALKALSRQVVNLLELRRTKIGLQRGIAESCQAQMRLAAQHAVARILAQSETLSDAGPKILRAICERLGWETGALWRVDRKARTLRCEDTWRQPSVPLAAFEAMSRSRTFTSGVGLPGRVWASGKAAWIVDVVADPNFPRAPIAAEAGLHGGFAFPIRLGPQVFGVMEFFSREGRAPDEGLLKIFEVIGSEIGQFIERKQSENMLKAIAAGTAAVTGSEFFESLVRHLALALDVRYAFVAECQGATRQRARSRAFWKGDGFGENFEYEVAATPCKVVLEGKVACFPERLQALFPEDVGLVELGAESYLGIPLLDHAKQIIGHLAVLDVWQMDAIPRELSVLQAFASRAGAELERLKAEERQRALLELNNSIITSLKLSDLLHATREALKRIIVHDRAAIAIYEPEVDDLRVYALEGSFAPDQLVIGKLLDVYGRRGTAPFDYHRPLLRNDLEAARRYSFDKGLLAAGMRSHCALPLVAGDRTIGILGISSKNKNQFSQSDFEFLKEAAGQIALAVANVQAYEEIEALRARLQDENVYLRSELIANVSHDLRTPIALMQGYLETLLMKEESLTAEKRRSYLEVAARQSEHLATLISELFELAKLDFRGYEINAEPLHLGELAQDVLQKFQLDAEKKQVALQVDIHPEVDFVRADIGLMERALENLLENALKHTRPGDAISLAVLPENGRVMVRVSDTGSGIPEQHLPHIFERFYRVDKARTSSAGGAGLGLAIVKRILDLHGSEIAVESALKSGTTFSFALPTAASGAIGSVAA